MLSTICSAKQKTLQICAELRHCQRWVTNRERQRVPQWRTRDGKTSALCCSTRRTYKAIITTAAPVNVSPSTLVTRSGTNIPQMMTQTGEMVKLSANCLIALTKLRQRMVMCGYVPRGMYASQTCHPSWIMMLLPLLNLLTCTAWSLFNPLFICCHPLSTTYIFSLKVTNRSFHYASPHLWNQLPVLFHQLCIKHSANDVTISNSSPTCSSLSPSITRSLFHSRLKTQA